jgi:hypothetical protein
MSKLLNIKKKGMSILEVSFLVYCTVTSLAGKYSKARDAYTKATDMNIKHKDMAPIYSNLA